MFISSDVLASAVVSRRGPELPGYAAFPHQISYIAGRLLSDQIAGSSSVAGAIYCSPS